MPPTTLKNDGACLEGNTCVETALVVPSRTDMACAEQKGEMKEQPTFLGQPENEPNCGEQKLQNEVTHDVTVENVGIPTRSTHENLFVMTFSSVDGICTNNTKQQCEEFSTHIHVQDISKFDTPNINKENNYNPVEEVNLADTIAFNNDDSNKLDYFNSLDNEYED